MRTWLETGGFEVVMPIFLISMAVAIIIVLGLTAFGTISGTAFFFWGFGIIVALFVGYLLDNYIWWKYVRGGGGAWF